MDEEEFLSTHTLRSFGSADAARADARARRLTRTALALWGRAGDLERQLEPPHPRVPEWIELSDLRELRESLGRFPNLDEPRYACLSSSSAFAAFWLATVRVGGQLLTPLQARCEIVRRAIEYLKGR